VTPTPQQANDPAEKEARRNIQKKDEGAAKLPLLVVKPPYRSHQRQLAQASTSKAAATNATDVVYVASTSRRTRLRRGSFFLYP
jgi:hypothetical protein